MRAAFLRKLDDIQFREVDLPAVGPLDVRLKIDACGICGTDVTSALGGGETYNAFGHEIAGTILEVGSAVSGLQIGTKVVLESSSACGICEHCRNERQYLCEHPRSFAEHDNLGFAEEVVSPAICADVFEEISPEEACLSEPLGVAIDMHRLADVEIGAHVVVSGLGPIGLMAIRLAKLSGAEKVYGCDLSAAKIRLETALAFGADEIIEVDKTPIEGYRFSQKPDRFMVTSPPKTIEQMIGVAANGAIISYIGIKWGEGANITFNANDFHFKKLQLRGSYASPALYTPMALHLIATGAIDADSLITHLFELKDIAQALRAAADTAKSLKVVVVNR